LDTDIKSFGGGVSALFGKEDEVAPAQLIAQFAKTHEVVTLFGGILEGKFIDAAKVKELSALPSKQQLLGQLVGTLNAPISGFVNVLAGNLRNLVGVLNNIKQSKAA
jgi:large subunit ribosomal protein L10